MNIKEIIDRTFYEICEQMDINLNTKSLHEDMVLLECGLDSLGFAVLVASLEEKLGFDPFIKSDESYYPKTYGEFVAFYEKMKP